MALQSAEELDDVVETAVMLPDFGVEDEPPLADEREPSRWQGTLVRVSSVMAVLVVSMAAAVIGSDRGTVPGPAPTVSATVVVPTDVPFDPVHGVITPGRGVVGKDIPIGSYIAVVDSRSTICEWTLGGTRAADDRWRTSRGQRTNTTAEVELRIEGQVFETQGCHWRIRG